MTEQKTIDRLKALLTQGKTKEELYKELLAEGWTIEAIEQNFNALKTEAEKEETSKLAIRVIVTIGALLIGAGIFSFVAANWPVLTKPEKITVILASMAAAYALGWYWQEQQKIGKTGAALFLLGAIIYGAGLFLVAQMFNIRANWPDGFVLWMFGVVALALALESLTLFCLAVFLGFIALAGQFEVIFAGPNSSRGFLLTSSFLLLTATVVTFIVGWFIRQRRPLDEQGYY
jgi:uncharacterized membrane protein